LIQDTGKDGPGLSKLLNPLMSSIVLPYLGTAQARRELEMPVPKVPPARERASTPLQSDPFKDAGMRLTYRTMLVLSVIAANPGASNRQIGDIAGVGDQGQMSKLLARLERIGLIAKRSHGHAKGEPNAWALTAGGRQVAQSIRVHTGTWPSQPARTQSSPHKGRE